MPKTLNMIWVHVVFTTRNRVPILTWNIRNEVCEFIKREANKSGIWVDTVNGVMDHVHILIRLHPSQKPSEVIGWIKGRSSHWLNNKYTWVPKFRWQEGYGIFSVSPQNIKNVRWYIYKQEEHHREKNFDDELTILRRLDYSSNKKLSIIKK